MDIDLSDSGELEKYLQEKAEKKLKKEQEKNLKNLPKIIEEPKVEPIEGLDEEPIEIEFEKSIGKFKKNENLRHAGQKINYTPRILEEYIRCSQDIIYFAEKYFYIVNIDEGKINIPLREYQKRMLKAFVGDDLDPRKSVCTLSSRQSGKTTVMTIYVLWYILFNSDKTVAILANKEKTSREILSRIRLAYENLPIWLQQGITDNGWNAESIKLENGTRVIASSTASTAIKGFSINLLILDEFAWVPSNIAEEFWNSVYPTITSGKSSKVIMVSCVTGNTRIATKQGLKKVEHFIKSDKSGAYKVRRYSILGLNKFRSGSIMVNSGYAKTIKFRFPHTKLECAEDHKLLCYTSRIQPKIFDPSKCTWKKAIDITKNDYIVQQKGMEIWGNEDTLKYGIKNHPLYDITHKDFLEIDEKFAYFLGIANAKMELNRNGIKRMELRMVSKYNLFKFLKYDLGFKFIIQKNDRGKYKYTFDNRNFYRFLENIGYKRLGKDRVIPEFVFQMSRKNVKQYIRGIFDSLAVHISNKTNNIIRIEDNSIEFLEDLQTILLNFGILTSIIERKDYLYASDRKPYMRHFLKLTGENIKYYSEIIGTNRPEFQAILDKFKDRTYSRYTVSKMFLTRYFKKYHSNNYVYDFSLDDIEEDPYCHSVAYNNIIGHQTPNGINKFYHIYKDAVKGVNNFRPVKINWWEMPGRDKAWKESIIKDIGEKNFQVEFGNRFLGSNSTLIDPDILEDLGNRVKEPIAFKHGYLMNIYEEPIKGALYILGVDSSRGTNKDYSVVQVLKISSEYEITQVAIYRCNTIIPHDFAQVCIGISDYYDGAYMMVESNDVGGQVADTIYYEFECDRVLNCDVKGIGIRCTKKSKSKGNNLLKRYLENGWLRLNDKRTVFEFTQYEEHLPDLFAANSGENDDCVLSLMWALYFIETPFFDGKSIAIKSLDSKYRLSEEDTLGNLPMFFDNGTREIDEDGFSWDY